MPSPAKRAMADGCAAPRLPRATITAHDFYGLFGTWKDE